VIKRIYIDTSVFGGYFDKEFDEETKPFFERILEKRIKIIVSEILELELYRAPDFIQDFFESLPSDLIERVELTDESRELAEKYILEKVVGKTSRADCQHIALATINKADVLASWNFKHIVNLERIRGYNSVNFREGYQMIEIRTPKEIFDYENHNK
jgi:predicted nucleic acid-binding protein